MAENQFRIIIVGGGIAGLATAVALRAPNRQITVLEKSRMLKEVGALISLQPNASKIVSLWKVDRFLESAEPLVDTAFRMLDVDGNLVNRISLDTQRWGGNRIVYHRQDLHSSLKAMVVSTDLPGEPATIRTSARVVDVDTKDGIVGLEGGETLQADLIVAADGIRSAARRFVLGTSMEPVPTGLSAYRILIDSKKLEHIEIPDKVFSLKDPVTTMIVGYDKRIVMGPGRGNKLFGIVALVPDKQMLEISTTDSWTSEGSRDKLLESFADFPPWLQEIFKVAPEIALWQLRDIPPLDQWVAGRMILIGDAAHAMLPTQGQGASQSIEDAEAIQAFFADITEKPSAKEVQERLDKVFAARHQRTSLIQQYSRQQAKPGTNGEDKKVKLNPEEFMDYNCRYDGVMNWIKKQELASCASAATSVEKLTGNVGRLVV